MGMHAVCAMQPFSETLTGLLILQVTSVAKHLLKSQLVPENN